MVGERGYHLAADNSHRSEELLSSNMPDAIPTVVLLCHVVRV